MPNFDAGHYFYTGLFPLKLDPERGPDGTVTAPSHLLREVLASLPNVSECPSAGWRMSPFARCRRTHFARFAVIDDPAYNGRDPGNAIIQGIRSVDLLVHQPVDHLSRPWLLFGADFDAADGSDAARDEWAMALWDVMEPELRAVFAGTLQFDRVGGREAFAAHIACGQVETTMPFNDYWIDLPKLPALSVPLLIAIAAVPALLFSAAAKIWLNIGWLGAIAAGLVGLALGAFAAYRLVLSRGARPFPAAAGGDLKSVLKSVYLQQQFTRFAIAQQGADAAALHVAFGHFLAEHRPGEVEAPTQAPGTVKS